LAFRWYFGDPAWEWQNPISCYCED
jgi:hypothetical protein